MKGITLTYVPNSYCNFGCSYCYLGKLTDKKQDSSTMAEDFKKVAQRLKEQDTYIVGLILHGAELTALPVEHVTQLFDAIEEYKNENKIYIWKLRKSRTTAEYIHVKTNMYEFDKFYDLFVKHKVSVSGSIDLPLRLHSKNRRLKTGQDTTDKVIANLKLLKDYPHVKHFSATMTDECLDVDEFCSDVDRLAETGYDMANDFYIMFVYNSVNKRKEAKMASDILMRDFYLGLRQRYKGTKYEKAVEYRWFYEFLGGFCINETNCGTNQILVQANGDSYICHRSQGYKELNSGNLFTNSYTDIVRKNIDNIRWAENKLELHQDCLECNWFHICQAGCTIQRQDMKTSKAYTCALQKAIYQNNPDIHPENPEEAQKCRDEFLRENKVRRLLEYRSPNIIPEMKMVKNSLQNIINRDERLKQLYAPDNFLITINGEYVELLQDHDDFWGSVRLTPNDEVRLFVKEECLTYNCDYPIDNFLWVDMLGGEPTTYGFEQRTETPHLSTDHIYYNRLMGEGLRHNGYVSISITDFIKRNSTMMKEGEYYHLHFTTRMMREYHYECQRKNAFYHAQAVNLPFPRLTFQYYLQ
ncbi:TPA: SPASM domain-containing protein [Campylobacter jejuni]|nr:SPASM domain-containing protein [Campylobacter jejuni]HEG8105707.1 SPASM domain-containing protein [Campylobacter jejuni]HEG8133945.1 SPASM domain-containing protein [Campylobacter jejuni]